MADRMMQENVSAAKVELTAEEVATVRRFAEECEVAGARPLMSHLTYGDSAPPPRLPGDAEASGASEELAGA